MTGVQTCALPILAAKRRKSFAPLFVTTKTCPARACGKVTPAPVTGTEVIFVTALTIFVDVAIVPPDVALADAVVDQYGFATVTFNWSPSVKRYPGANGVGVVIQIVLHSRRVYHLAPLYTTPDFLSNGHHLAQVRKQFGLDATLYLANPNARPTTPPDRAAQTPKTQVLTCRHIHAA